RYVDVCLCDVDNRGQPETVPPLCQIQSQGGLTKELCRNVDSLKGIHRACPRHAYVSSDPFLRVSKALCRFISSIYRRLAARRKQMTVENRKIQVHSNTLISARDARAIDQRQETGSSKNGHGRPGQIFFRFRKTNRGVIGRAEARNLGAVIESFHDKGIWFTPRTLRHRIAHDLIVHLLMSYHCPRLI